MIEVVEPGFEILTNPATVEQYTERRRRVWHKLMGWINEGLAKHFTRIARPNHRESMFERASITIKIICSHAALHQLVRYHAAAYSQGGRRQFCGQSKHGQQVICPPYVGLEPGNYIPVYSENGVRLLRDGEIWEAATIQQCRWIMAMDYAYSEYLRECKEGVSIQDASYVLPGATKTEVVIPCSVQQWRHILRVQNGPHVQGELQRIFNDLFEDFEELMPAIFGNLRRISFDNGGITW